jgi:hypothetical protein
MNEIKRFVELNLAESNRNVLIALEDVIEVIEENRCVGKFGTPSYKEYKIIRVYTKNHNAYECNYSEYEKLKHFLVETWTE